MSAFLGPVHHWLYNKLLWQENLLQTLYRTFPEALEDVESQAATQYGKATFEPLESVIDTGNIHGWLQTRIDSHEHRMAFAIMKALENRVDLEDIKALFTEDGLKAGKQVEKPVTPEALYNTMNNFLLDGMPCDRVNIPITNTSNEVIWERRLCLHAPIWEAVGIDPQIFYTLRSAWLNAYTGEAYRFAEISKGKFAFVKEA